MQKQTKVEKKLRTNTITENKLYTLEGVIPIDARQDGSRGRGEKKEGEQSTNWHKKMN